MLGLRSRPVRFDAKIHFTRSQKSVSEKVVKGAKKQGKKESRFGPPFGGFVYLLFYF